jgi:uncharacterized protein (TIGR02284 family)
MAADAQRDEVIFTLNDLSETCVDGQQGFEEAAAHAENPHLKRACDGYALERAAFAGEIQNEVLAMGVEPDRGGSIPGALHRRWIDVKAAIVGRDDLAILAECERGDEVALARYREALEKELPAPIREIVQAQYERIERARNYFREFRRTGLAPA